jgi:predicted kinase
MTVLSSTVDLNLLREYSDRKLIRTQIHPELPLYIHNYTELCQYSRAWDDVTKLCRGLVTDADGSIVARSFRKFFNFGEPSDDHVPCPEFEVQEKLDGSLMLVFYYAGEWRAASRGSFCSVQAMEGMRMLQDLYSTEQLNTEYTYVFEIIYPENRIVLDYGDTESLTFLACFTKDGQEIQDQEQVVRACGFGVVQTYPFDDYRSICDLNWTGAEGFVVRFSNGHRVKMKFEKYLKLHRTVTNLTVLRVWEIFCSASSSSALEGIPDEWMPWVTKQLDKLQEQYNDLEDSAREQFDVLQRQHGNKRDFALAIKENPLRDVLFKLWDGTDISAVLHSRIKPSGKTATAFCGTKKAARTPPTGKPATPPEVVLMVGISGSGKSTRARDIVRGSHRHAIVSRDALRAALYGYEDSNIRDYYRHPAMASREERITEVQISVVHTLLEAGTSVIIDDTNCSQSTVNGLLRRLTGYSVRFEVMDVDLHEAIARDEQRASSVSSDVILKQHAKLTELKKQLSLEPREAARFASVNQDMDLPPCYVFDVDGTLSINNGRGWYDWSSVCEDSISADVRDCAIALHEAGFKIVVCTGRDAVCAQATADWLRSYHVPFDELHMRKEGDGREDAVIKEELWRDIATRFCIRAMFDDRQSVVLHARSLGFKVYQVQANMC